MVRTGIKMMKNMVVKVVKTMVEATEKVAVIVVG